MTDKPQAITKIIDVPVTGPGPIHLYFPPDLTQGQLEFFVKANPTWGFNLPEPIADKLKKQPALYQHKVPIQNLIATELSAIDKSLREVQMNLDANELAHKHLTFLLKERCDKRICLKRIGECDEDTGINQKVTLGFIARCSQYNMCTALMFTYGRRLISLEIQRRQKQLDIYARAAEKVTQIKRLYDELERNPSFRMSGNTHTHRAELKSFHDAKNNDIYELRAWYDFQKIKLLDEIPWHAKQSDKVTIMNTVQLLRECLWKFKGNPQITKDYFSRVWVMTLSYGKYDEQIDVNLELTQGPVLQKERPETPEPKRRRVEDVPVMVVPQTNLTQTLTDTATESLSDPLDANDTLGFNSIFGDLDTLDNLGDLDIDFPHLFDSDN
jgi:hypothetical protein